MAQRVMDCGDAGHILLSKHVAEDLEEYGHWQPHPARSWECEVKHGNRIHNREPLYQQVGNPVGAPKVPRLWRGSKAGMRWDGKE